MATSNLAVQNWFETTLSSAISSTDTTIPINTVPTGSEGYLVIEPDNSSNREIIYFTSKTAGAVICPSVAAGRGVDGTTGISHASGATVRMNIVSAYWQALQNGTGLNSGALSGTPFATGWITSALPAVSSVTANGNHSYDVTFASTVASTLSPGARLRLSRTVAAPTQCTDLESSSSQYYSKTTPNGMTFTDDFVVSAWVKLESYPSGRFGIATRYNGTSGYQLRVDNSGQISMYGFNAGAANFSGVISYQSIPLGKWVHVAAQLDMSAFTATTTTSYIMIDGVDVPASVSRSGTNPIALVQAGDLQLGATAGTDFMDGKIAQVAIYSAKVTQAVIKASMNQTLSGSETSLISAYSFNNSINDLSANANNLTANGSAVATNADSPFALDANGTPGGTYEWGIVTKVATTTATVQTPEGSAIPTSGGVSTVDMSVHKAPFGFPADSGKWRVLMINKGILTKSSPTINTWYNLTPSTGVQGGTYLTVPVGVWRVGYQAGIYSVLSAAGITDQFTTLSTTASTETDGDYTCWAYYAIANATSTSIMQQHFKEKEQNLSASTAYYVNSKHSAGSSTIELRGDQGGTKIYADLALL